MENIRITLKDKIIGNGLRAELIERCNIQILDGAADKTVDESIRNVETIGFKALPPKQKLIVKIAFDLLSEHNLSNDLAIAA